MKASFLPKTRAGKWFVALIIISVISILIFNLGITGVERGTPAAIAFGIVLLLAPKLFKASDENGANR